MKKEKRIIFTDLSGNIKIITPSPNCKFSLKEIAKDAITKMGYSFKEIKYQIINKENIPYQDRKFSSAWIEVSGGVSIDMNKAKEIHKNFIRERRDVLLHDLDKLQRRDEDLNLPKNQKILRKKQLLRDATQDPKIEESKSIDELKDSWDSELLGPSPYFEYK